MLNGCIVVRAPLVSEVAGWSLVFIGATEMAATGEGFVETIISSFGKGGWEQVWREAQINQISYSAWNIWIKTHKILVRELSVATHLFSQIMQLNSSVTCIHKGNPKIVNIKDKIHWQQPQIGILLVINNLTAKKHISMTRRGLFHQNSIIFDLLLLLYWQRYCHSPPGGLNTWPTKPYAKL